MHYRLRLCVITVLALLWQGQAAAAMAPMLMSAPAPMAAIMAALPFALVGGLWLLFARA